MQYWVWLIIGVALIVLEIVVPSFVVIWFGIAALLTGVLAWWLTGLASQLLAFSLLSVLCFATGWFGFVRNWKARSLAGQSKEAVIGEVGIVSQLRGDAFAGGKVRFQVPVLGTDEWEFVSDDALVIGDRCAISDVLGNKLKIRKL